MCVCIIAVLSCICLFVLNLLLQWARLHESVSSLCDIHWLHITRLHFTNRYWTREQSRRGKHPELCTSLIHTHTLILIHLSVMLYNLYSIQYVNTYICLKVLSCAKGQYLILDMYFGFISFEIVALYLEMFWIWWIFMNIWKVWF